MSAKHSFDECVKFLQDSMLACLSVLKVELTQRADINLDPGFESFYEWCNSNGIPLVIVSR